jgi:hypothetical protein
MAMKKNKDAVNEDERIAVLHEKRKVALHLDGRRLKNAAEAARFIHERLIVMQVGRSGIAVLSDAIAGRLLPGSWMANPEVKSIYEVFVALGAREDVEEARLVQGKLVLISPQLGPLVERIAIDEQRRSAAMKKLSPLAKRLFERVEADGELRMDQARLPAKEGKAARSLLEQSLLVTSEDLHTERGSHTVLLHPWHASPLARRHRKEALSLQLDDAETRLLAACVHSAVIADERDVKKWFSFADARLAALVAEGRVDRIVGRKTWIAAER